MSGQIALMADVHGNLHALRVVLDEVRRAGAKSVICAGDLVGYGPFPNECVDALREVGTVCVAGNHDLMAIGALPVHGGRFIRHSTEWTRAELRTDTCTYLSALPVNLSVGEIVVAHGSLEDPEKYTVTDDEGVAEIARMARRDPESRVLVLGHTHQRRVVSEDRNFALTPRDGRIHLEKGMRHMINPGSVGQSRDWMPPPRARFMLIDLDAGHLDCRAVDYDVAACAAALRERGLPPYSMHLMPGRVGRAARYVRDALNA